MTDDVLVYYTECREGKQKYYLAIQADSKESYDAMVDDFISQNPGCTILGYTIKTPKEYKEYLRGY